MTKEATQKQERTVSLGFYIRDLVLTAIIAAIVSAIAMYFFTINISSEARASVVKDMTALKASTQSAK
jgi:hypothetical protein